MWVLRHDSHARALQSAIPGAYLVAFKNTPFLFLRLLGYYIIKCYDEVASFIGIPHFA